MVIVHDAIKTIQNGVFPIFLKRERKPVSFLKTPKKHFFKQKKQVGCFLFKRTGFFQT